MTNSPFTKLIKISLLAIVALIVGLGAWQYINTYIYRPKATGEDLTISLSPSSGAISGEQKVTLTLNATGLDNKIAGFDIYLKTTGQASITKTNEPIGLGSSVTDLFTEVTKQITATETRLTYVSIKPTVNLPSTVSIDLSVKGVADGAGTIEVETTKSQVVSPTAGKYQVPSIVGSYTFSGGGPAPSGNVKLNLSLKFAGITSKVNKTWPVKITIVNKDLNVSLTQTVNFTTDDNGIWSAAVSFQAVPGADYKVLVKGPKHAQKKICEAAPTESSVGVYSCSDGKIVLTDGDNTLDFSHITLFPGDLNQDGVINAQDLEIVRNKYNKSDAAALKAADVDLSGEVNTMDSAWIVRGLATRVDEN